MLPRMSLACSSVVVVVAVVVVVVVVVVVGVDQQHYTKRHHAARTPTHTTCACLQVTMWNLPDVEFVCCVGTEAPRVVSTLK